MAPAVGAVAALGDDRVRTLRWEGRGIELEAVVSRLHEMQLELSRHEIGEQEHPHPRNCVLNLVVVLGDHHRAEMCDRLVAGLAASHPLRAILVHPGGGHSEGTLDAEIVTEAHRLVTGFPVQREQVMLHVRGGAEKHLASLVEPLLVPDVPTFLWWSGRERLDEGILAETVAYSDVLIVDSGLMERPAAALVQVTDVAVSEEAPIGVSDLRWGRQKPWRDAIAQFFAPADRRALLAGLDELVIESAGSGPDSRVGAILLAGWVAGALGWPLTGVRSDDGATEATAERAGGRAVQVRLRSVASEAMSHGELLTVRLAGRSKERPFTLTIERDQGGDPHAHVTVALGGGEPVRQRLTLPRMGDPDLLVHVLWGSLRDPVLERALVAARPLLEAAAR